MPNSESGQGASGSKRQRNERPFAHWSIATSCIFRSFGARNRTWDGGFAADWTRGSTSFVDYIVTVTTIPGSS